MPPQHVTKTKVIKPCGPHVAHVRFYHLLALPQIILLLEIPYSRQGAIRKFLAAEICLVCTKNFIINIISNLTEGLISF